MMGIQAIVNHLKKEEKRIAGSTPILLGSHFVFCGNTVNPCTNIYLHTKSVINGLPELKAVYEAGDRPLSGDDLKSTVTNFATSFIEAATLAMNEDKSDG